jgi:hypothetical protein
MKNASGNACKAAICRSCIEISRALVRAVTTHSEIAMKIKKIVSELHTVTLIYGAITFIIA